MTGKSIANQNLRHVITFTPQPQERMLDRRYRGKHAGEACVLLAGGPSVAEVNLRELLPCRFVAANAANWWDGLEPVREHVVAGVLLDEALLVRELRRVVRTVDYPLFVGNTPHDTDILIDYLNALGVYRIPSNHTEGLGDSFARFSNGGNSGFAAFQLAIVLGFRTVGLLGLDGLPNSGPQRFHDEYGTVENGRSHLEGWCDLLDASAPLAELMGVTVLNLSPRSALRAFPKVDAAGWRQAVATVGDDCSAPRPVDVLRVRFGGRVRLPFPTPGPDATSQGSATCYGGARNVADPGRYRPLPDGLDELVVAGGASWCELRAAADGGASAVLACAAQRESRAALEALPLLESAPEDVEAWLRAALERAGSGRRAIELGDWLASGLEHAVEWHAVVCRTAARDVAEVASGLAWLRRSVRVLTCAVDGREYLQPTGASGLLRLLADDWRILEYRMSGNWLSVALRPLDI